MSEREALKEMQLAIDAGYNDPDPAVRAYLATLLFKRRPTPQELVGYLAKLP